MNTKKQTTKVQDVNVPGQEDLNPVAMVPAVNDLQKPQKDTAFAQKAAILLKDIIRQNGWSRRLGGQSEHIQYEGWQTVGKYYGYMVKTKNATPIEIMGVQGFKAEAVVVNEITGVEMGAAEAYCMRDEPNWRNKPIFQLASMAQTRAGSKALRQNLGFVVALAGYSPTPSEEMTGEEAPTPKQMRVKIEDGIVHEDAEVSTINCTCNAPEGRQHGRQCPLFA